MSSLQLGRLLVGAPLQWYEPMGDPVSTQGGAVVPGTRSAPQYQPTIGTLAADGQTDTPAARQAIRRKLRSLLNNSPLKMQAFVYVLYSDDPEQNGWYVPDQSSLQDYSGASGLATGFWQLSGINFYLVGHQRTHREARQVWMKDLRTGLYARDALGWILSTDFSALPALALSVLPNGVSQAAQTVSGQVVALTALPAGRDGGTCQLCSGLSDLAVVSYERAESAMNLSDVIVYDRSGQITAPSTGPDTSWQEVSGPDWPWNWQTAGQPNDCPVLDNGLCRVRYDGTNTPGFRVDVWNGAAYVEQGKMCVWRFGDTAGYCDTFVSAGLVEYTPERAVVSVVLSRAADLNSRERVFITMQRGVTGCTFEAYPASKVAGTLADALLSWSVANADVNGSAIKCDSQTQPPPIGNGKIIATAGSGSANFAAAVLGNANFTTSENYVVLLRCSAVATATAYQVNLAALQAANASATAQTESIAYGSSRNEVFVNSQNGAGYVSVDVSFTPTTGDQVIEAENVRFTGGGTTASQVTDALASNGLAVKDTQATPAHNTLLKQPTSLIQGKYRIFARVKVDAATTGSFSFGEAVNTTTVTGVTATAWTWIDCGDLLMTQPGGSNFFAAVAWHTAGAGSAYIDRVELFLTEDRTRTGFRYSGARDAGQAALMDSRALGTVVAR